MIGAATLAVAALVLWWAFLRPRLPAAERGRRLAERSGCFACHGPEGMGGRPNPGRKVPTVPGFEGDVMMYARDGAEIREWIRDGVPARRAKSTSWRKDRDRGVLRMPAFGDRFSARELDDLVAFVQTMAKTPAPESSAARLGRERAEALGCFGCHGRGGRLARPNPGSLKGYVPSWDGADFPELVRDREEFREWIEDGISKRFASNRGARFFLGRAVLAMPAYAGHLEPGDVDALWAYVRWLRGESGPETSGAASSGEP